MLFISNTNSEIYDFKALALKYFQLRRLKVEILKYKLLRLKFRISLRREGKRIKETPNSRKRVC